MKKRVTRMLTREQKRRQRHDHQPGQGVEHLRIVFEDAPEGVCVLDRRLRLVVWNRAATEITGYTAPESLGRCCGLVGNSLVLDPSCSGSGLSVSEGRTAALPSVCGFHIKSKFGDGAYLNLRTAVMPLRYANLAFFVHLFRPIPISSGPVNSVEWPIIRHVMPSVAGLLGDEPGRPVLTPREDEILRLLAEGKTAKPIAAALSLAIPTVRTHIQNILRKLDVSSCLEAVVRFLRGKGENPFCSADGGRGCAVTLMAGSRRKGHPGSKW